MSADVRLALLTSAMMAVLSAAMSALTLVGALAGGDCASLTPLLVMFVGGACSCIGCAHALAALSAAPPSGSPVGLDPAARPKGECVVCTARPADTTLAPCGHGGLCLACALAWNERCGRPACPTCRAPVRLLGYAPPAD